MENELILRPYHPNDWHGVKALLEQGYDSNIDQQTLERNYIGENRAILIAQKNNNVVGCIFWEVKVDYVRPCRTLFLTYLVVDERYRRQGIARKLYEKIEEISRNLNCSAIEFTSANFRVNAHALYKSIGYTVKATSIFIKEINQ